MAYSLSKCAHFRTLSDFVYQIGIDENVLQLFFGDLVAVRCNASRHPTVHRAEVPTVMFVNCSHEAILSLEWLALDDSPRIDGICLRRVDTPFFTLFDIVFSSIMVRAREIENRFVLWIRSIEEVSIGPGQCLAALASIIAIRNLLEVATSHRPVFDGLAAFVHFPLAYLAPFLALTLVLSFWSAVPPSRVCRLMIAAWTLTLFPPLVDMLSPSVEAPSIGYLRADPSDLPWILIRFFDPSVALGGTTVGIRLETLAAVLLGALYVWLRCHKPLRVLFAAVSLYLTSLFFFALPVLVLMLWRIVFPDLTHDDLLWGQTIIRHGSFDSAPNTMAILWLVPLTLILGLVWWFLEGKAPEQAWIRGKTAVSPRTGSTLFLVLVLLAGHRTALLLGLPPNSSAVSAPYDLLAPMGAALALVCAMEAVIRCGAVSRFPSVFLLLCAVALTAALGHTTAVTLAVSAGAALLVSLVSTKARIRALYCAIGLAIASLGAFSTGYALYFGTEALARLPFPLVVSAIAAGLVCGVLTSSLVHAKWRNPVVILLGVGFFVALPGIVARETIHEDLKRSALCVARIERLEGEEYLRQNDHQSARLKFEKALECNASDIVSLLKLGLIFVREKKMEEARRYYERAATLAPDSIQALANLGAIYLATERWEKGAEIIDRAYRLDSRDPRILSNRAEAFEMLGKTAEAMDAWREYIDIARHRLEDAKDVAYARRRLEHLESLNQPDPH